MCSGFKLVLGDDYGHPFFANRPPHARFRSVLRCSVRAIPHDKAIATCFDYKRAKAVLAVVCIQYGFVRTLLTHLGDCITLCAGEEFHDEARWPVGLNEVELQERRRLIRRRLRTRADRSSGRCTS